MGLGFGLRAERKASSGTSVSGVGVWVWADLHSAEGVLWNRVLVARTVHACVSVEEAEQPHLPSNRAPKQWSKQGSNSGQGKVRQWWSAAVTWTVHAGVFVIETNSRTCPPARSNGGQTSVPRVDFGNSSRARSRVCGGGRTAAPVIK